MIKTVNDDGKIEFTQQEIIALVRKLHYTTKRRRIIHKVFKKAIYTALEEFFEREKNK